MKIEAYFLSRAGSTGADALQGLNQNIKEYTVTTTTTKQKPPLGHNSWGKKSS